MTLVGAGAGLGFGNKRLTLPAGCSEYWRFDRGHTNGGMGAVTQSGTGPAITILGSSVPTAYCTNLRFKCTTRGARGTAYFSAAFDGVNYGAPFLTSASVVIGNGITLQFGTGSDYETDCAGQAWPKSKWWDGTINGLRWAQTGLGYMFERQAGGLRAYSASTSYMALTGKRVDDLVSASAGTICAALTPVSLTLGGAANYTTSNRVVYAGSDSIGISIGNNAGSGRCSAGHYDTSPTYKYSFGPPGWDQTAKHVFSYRYDGVKIYTGVDGVEGTGVAAAAVNIVSAVPTIGYADANVLHRAIAYWKRALTLAELNIVVRIMLRAQI